MIVVVDLGELRWRRDVGVGEWIGERLGGPFGYVGSVVPRGYAAYARVLHPVPAPGPSFDGAPLRWADVCRATGRRLHALAQWSAIAVPPGVPITYDARWRDVAPDVGNPRPGGPRHPARAARRPRDAVLLRALGGVRLDPRQPGGRGRRQ